MAAVETNASADQTTLFQQLDSYPWADDNEFQGGLSAILGSVQNPGQVEHLTLRAKCYYYARKAGRTVDFDGYRHWVEGHHNGHTNGVGSSTAGVTPVENDAGAGGMLEAPKPASFAQIVELITEGKPIPGIKDIPDTILVGQASESQAERRKKPWEKEAADADSPSWMTAA